MTDEPIKMKGYLLRGLPAPVWDAARARASEDGVSIRVAIVALLSAYVAGDVRLHLGALQAAAAASHPTPPARPKPPKGRAFRVTAPDGSVMRVVVPE